MKLKIKKITIRYKSVAHDHSNRWNPGIWVDAAGTTYRIQDLQDEHLKNIINLLHHIYIRSSFMSNISSLSLTKFYELKAELNRRGLSIS